MLVIMDHNGLLVGNCNERSEGGPMEDAYCSCSAVELREGSSIKLAKEDREFLE